MRRLLIIGLALLFLSSLHTAAAQDTEVYRNDLMGLSFRYPASWTAREQPATETVTVASGHDLESVADGKAPAGLLFSITTSTFRQIGAGQLEDFAAILKKLAMAPDSSPTPLHVGGVDGLTVEMIDAAQDVAAQTALLSIGRRRVAVIRGVATVASWKTGGSKSRFNDLIATLSFFPSTDLPTGDSFGKVLWQLPADKVSDLVSIAAGGDGSMIYVTSRTQGIWRISANGTSQPVIKPDGIGVFDGIGVLPNGNLYVADPTNNVIWLVPTGSAAPSKLIGGRVGTGRGMFGVQSPQVFAFGTSGFFYVLDKNEKGPRIQLFSRGGDWAATWDLSDALTASLDNPSITSDGDGNAYLTGRDLPAIIKVSTAGKVASQDLGKAALANNGILGLIADRYGNFFVATADQGILNLDSTGKLIGVIGEGYDEAGPPKPGQLGKPIAMAVGDGGRLLYVLDTGKYPQVVAFVLNGNSSLDIAAGTRDAGTITYGDTVKGEVTDKTFIDSYQFNGSGGDVITITMQAGDGSNIDPYVEVLGPTGARLVANDDAKHSDTPLGALDAQIKSYTLPFTGTFAIRATRFGREATTTTGAYSLTLTLEHAGKKAS